MLAQLHLDDDVVWTGMDNNIIRKKFPRGVHPGRVLTFAISGQRICNRVIKNNYDMPVLPYASTLICKDYDNINKSITLDGIEKIVLQNSIISIRRSRHIENWLDIVPIVSGVIVAYNTITSNFNIIGSNFRYLYIHFSKPTTVIFNNDFLTRITCRHHILVIKLMPNLFVYRIDYKWIPLSEYRRVRPLIVDAQMRGDIAISCPGLKSCFYTTYPVKCFHLTRRMCLDLCYPRRVWFG